MAATLLNPSNVGLVWALFPVEHVNTFWFAWAAYVVATVIAEV